MKTLFSFIQKEFYHILRDPKTLLLLFGLPVAQILIFGFALNNEIKDASIAILDQSNDLHSRQLTERMVSSGYFKHTQTLQRYADIEKAFSYGHIKMALVFPPNFGEAFVHGGDAQVQIVSDATDQNTAVTLSNYANAIIRGYEQEQLALSGPAAVRGSILVEPRMIFNAELKGAYVFVPGVMAMVLLLISAVMTSVTIAREKETGTMELLMVSPITQLHIVIGKVVPYMVISFINAVVILLIGVFGLGMPMNGNVILLLAAALLFILLALSFGILVSAISKTQMEAMLRSMIVLMMPTIFLSGFIFPIESMPQFLQIGSYGVPARHFIVIIKTIMIKGGGLELIWPQTLILAGMIVLTLLLALLNLKTRLQ